MRGDNPKMPKPDMPAPRKPGFFRRIPKSPVGPGKPAGSDQKGKPSATEGIEPHILKPSGGIGSPEELKSRNSPAASKPPEGRSGQPAAKGSETTGKKEGQPMKVATTEGVVPKEEGGGAVAETNDASSDQSSQDNTNREDLNSAWPSSDKWEKQWEQRVAESSYTISHFGNLSNSDGTVVDEHAMELRNGDGRVLAVEYDVRKFDTKGNEIEGIQRQVHTRFADGRRIEQEFSATTSPDGRLHVQEYSRSEFDTNGAATTIFKNLTTRDDGTWKYTEEGPYGTRIISHKFDSGQLKWTTTETLGSQTNEIIEPSRVPLDPSTTLEKLEVAIPSGDMIESPLESFAYAESAAAATPIEKGGPQPAETDPGSSAGGAVEKNAEGITTAKTGSGSSSTGEGARAVAPPIKEGTQPLAEPSGATPIDETGPGGSSGAGKDTPETTKATETNEGGTVREKRPSSPEGSGTGGGGKGEPGTKTPEGTPVAGTGSGSSSTGEDTPMVELPETTTTFETGEEGSSAGGGTAREDRLPSPEGSGGGGGDRGDTGNPPVAGIGDGDNRGNRRDNPANPLKEKEAAARIALDYDAALDIPSSPEEAEKQGFKPDPGGPRTDPNTGIKTTTLTRTFLNNDGSQTHATLEFTTHPGGRQQAALTKGTPLKDAIITEKASRDIPTGNPGNIDAVTQLERTIKPGRGPATSETIVHRKSTEGQSLEHSWSRPQKKGAALTGRTTTNYNDSGQPVTSSYRVETGAETVQVKIYEDDTTTYIHSQVAKTSDFPAGTVAILKYDAKGQLTSSNVLDANGNPVANPENHPFVQGHIALNKAIAEAEASGWKTAQALNQNSQNEGQNPGQTYQESERKIQELEQRLQAPEESTRNIDEFKAREQELEQEIQEMKDGDDATARRVGMSRSEVDDIKRGGHNPNGGSNLIQIPTDRGTVKVPIGGFAVAGDLKGGWGNHYNSPTINIGTGGGRERGRGDSGRQIATGLIAFNISLGHALSTAGHEAERVASSAAHH